MAARGTKDLRLPERRGVVEIREGAGTRPRVIRAVLVATGVGELDERLMHPHARRLARGRNRTDALESTTASPTPTARTRWDEGQLHLHLGILGKVLGHRHV